MGDESSTPKPATSTPMMTTKPTTHKTTTKSQNGPSNAQHDPIFRLRKLEQKIGLKNFVCLLFYKINLSFTVSISIPKSSSKKFLTKTLEGKLN